MSKECQKDCKRIAKISKGFEGVKELIGVRFVMVCALTDECA